MGWIRLCGGRGRIAAAAGVAVLVALAVAGGLWPAPSAEPTVQAFLLAWQDGQYQQAAAMTTGRPAAVAGLLAGIYRQLDASRAALQVESVSQHGSVATASFTASITLDRGSKLTWSYQGGFGLVRAGSGWKVQWNPSVLVPGLRSGQRLAVRAVMPARAPLLSAADGPLGLPSDIYVLGVRPGLLARPAVTARALAADLAVSPGGIGGQISAAPSGSFLELAWLRPAAYRRLAGRLHQVPGLVIRRTTVRLFRSVVPAVTGSVELQAPAAPRAGDQHYQLGATAGMSGLEQAFQRRLTGSVTTQIVVDGRGGRQLRVLHDWPGRAPAPVRTTIDMPVQRAADTALASGRSSASSAALVAIRAGSGKILAVAARRGPGLPGLRPLDGSYRPGQAFTIVSTAALLATGFKVGTPIPCEATNRVGGEVFANHPAEPDLGAQPPFTTDFAHACGTAFAGLSLQLRGAGLMRAGAGFGIGADWRLPLASFPGAMRVPAGYAQLAAETIGTGGVRVSPLDMALAAGVVQSGSWHPPSLVSDPPDPGLAPRRPLSGRLDDTLRALMRSAVTRGAAAAGGVRGVRGRVFGQVGSCWLRWHGEHLPTSWFVGFRGDVAYAVLVAGTGPGASAAQLAGQFARYIGAGTAAARRVSSAASYPVSPRG